jgi:hypothetical protein
MRGHEKKTKKLNSVVLVRKRTIGHETDSKFLTEFIQERKIWVNSAVNLRILLVSLTSSPQYEGRFNCILFQVSAAPIFAA